MRIHTALGALMLLCAAPAAQAQAFPFYLDVDLCPGQPAVLGSLGNQCDPGANPYAEEWVFAVNGGGTLQACWVQPGGGPGPVFDSNLFWSKTGNQVTMDLSYLGGMYLTGFLAGGGTSGGVLVDAAGLATPLQSQLASWDGTKVQQSAWDDCVTGTGGGGPVNWGNDGFYQAWSDVPGALPCPDIRATGAPLGLGDDASAQVFLVTPFTFYGVPRIDVWVNNNGNLTFGLADSDFSNDPLPQAEEMIAPYWDDLINRGGFGQEVYHQAIPGGYAFQWYLDPFANNPSLGDLVDIRAVLWDSGQITTCIADSLAGNVASDSGVSATVGIASALNGSWLQYSHNTPVATNGLVLDYVPTP